VPGDPAVTLAGGENATPEAIAAVRKDLNLDDGFFQRYWLWLKDAVQGDFGNSFVSKLPVSEELARTIPVTLSLVIAAALLGVMIGLPIGLLAGMRAGTRRDRALMTGTVVGIAIPNFVLAMMLISLFAINWKIFPALGFVKFSDNPAEWARHILMPAFCLSLAIAASMARQTRAALADVMESKYVRAAWAKGGTPRRVVAKHALKNAAIPALTVFGLQLGGLLGGSLLIEQIFSIPGLGSYIVSAVFQRDLPVIQAVGLMFALIYVLINLAIDITYGYLNPRVRVT
jgi:peptide/nickel transport system permease protein